MNIALLGFGTVGSHFYKLCEGRTDLHVAAVLSRRPRPELTCTVTADYDEIVRDPSIDIVVEVMGGIEPAYSYLCAAMRAGKHVVTANKQLMCAHFEELTSLAKEKRRGVALHRRRGRRHPLAHLPLPARPSSMRSRPSRAF